MTVAQLIEELQKHPQHLPVCVGDWNVEECYPSEWAAEKITVETRKYQPSSLPAGAISACVEGTFVCIASDL